MSLKFEYLSPKIGTVIRGIDLSQPGAIEEYGPRISQLLLDRQVIFFRDQNIDVATQVRLAQVVGEVRPVASKFQRHPENSHVEILQSSGEPTGTDVWHTDLSFVANPPKATMLHAQTLPPTGGDTIWASMTAAYESLSPLLRAYLETLQAIHDWETPELLIRIVDQEAYHQRRRDNPPAEKPVISTHPETGKKVVNVNELYVSRIVGVSRSESRALVSFLTGLARVPEWQVRFRWEPRSLAVWDNRSAQHYAIRDYSAPRSMHRLTIY